MSSEPTPTTTRSPASSAATPGAAAGVGGGGRWLPAPRPGRREAEAYVMEHLGSLLERRGRTGPLSSPVIRGGQEAADEALAAFSVVGYRAWCRDAYPQGRRASSGLSPYVRHGLLGLDRLWDHVAGGPPDDVEAFRHALLHQEYARHWYARLGHRTRTGDGDVADVSAAGSGRPAGWDRRMGCVEIALDELEEDGWLVGETRWWLADRWVASGRSWRDGEDHLHRHLLDGSRAAGRLSWRRAAGLDGVPAPVVSRWDVERHAPGLCATCELVHRCPIEDTIDRIDRELGLCVAGPPDQPDRLDRLDRLDRPDRPDRPGTVGGAEIGVRRDGARRDRPRGEGARRVGSPAGDLAPLLAADPDPEATAGPSGPVLEGEAEAVWLTAESMGDADPALVGHPELPVLFVFDERLLLRLRLSAKRLVFLVETLGDLGQRRPLEIALGDPVGVLAGRQLATTFTPVPGWRRRSSRLDLAALHPWPWLHRPHGDGVTTYLEWLAEVELQRELGPDTKR